MLHPAPTTKTDRPTSAAAPVAQRKPTITRKPTATDSRRNSRTDAALAEDQKHADQSAHARVQFIAVLMWVGVLLVYVSLGFYMTSLIYNTWQELPNESKGKTVNKIRGKTLAQFLLISLGCAFGGSGAICLTMRIFGLRNAKPYLKYIGTATTICMGALGYTAVRIYPSIDYDMYPTARYGAGYDYANSSFQYSYIGVGFLIAHEIAMRIVQRLRTQHHLHAAAQLRLKQLKKQPENVVHAKQALVTAQQLALEQKKDAKGDLPKQSEQLSPPGTRPTAADAGEDVHLQQLVHRLLHDKDKLTPAQLSVLFSLVVFFYVVQMGGLLYSYIEGWDLRQGIEFSVIVSNEDTSGCVV